MEIQVDIQATRMLEGLRKAPRKIAYAVSYALNDTAFEIQAAEQEMLASWVHLRSAQTRKRFSGPIIKSKPSSLVAYIPILDKSSAKDHWFMRYLEQGFAKTSSPRLAGFNENPGAAYLKARGIVPIPGLGTPARPDAMSIETRSMVPKNLALKRSKGWAGQLFAITKTGRAKYQKFGEVTKRGHASEGVGPWRGKFRTFMTNRWIAQRDAEGFHVLFILHRGPVQVRPHLNFFRTAQALIPKAFERNLKRQMDATVMHEMGRST